MMYGYIYKTTDTRNGLIYIGQHKSKRFNPFYFGSGRDICQIPYEDRLKYYKVELLHVVVDTGNADNDANELDRLEIEEIAKHDSTNPKIGYNRSKGGQKTAGWYRGIKGRITLHKNDVTVRVHPEYVDSYLADGYEYGMSEKLRQKMSITSIRVQSSVEYREKQRKAQTGKKRTAESKQLLRDAANKRWQNPEFKKSRIGIKIINNGIIERRLQPDEAKSLVDTGEWKYGRMKMKPHSYKLVKIYNDKEKRCTAVKIEEAEQLIATGEWRRGQKPMSQKQRNIISKIRTNRVWMNKDGKSIQAKQEQVEELLQQGWTKGMLRTKK